MAFQFIHLRFLCVASRDLVFPAFSGSTLRGVFGHALRELECHQEQNKCQKCSWQNQCRYNLVFETSLPPGEHYLGMEYSPHPFVIQPPGNGYTKVLRKTTFPFEMILLGPAMDVLPTIVTAWKRAGELGLGPLRTPFEVIRITDLVSHKELFQNGRLIQTAQRVVIHGEEVLDVPEVVLLETLTPMRILVQGKLVHRPRKAVLYRAMIRRLKLLNHFFGDGQSLFDDKALQDQLSAVEYYCETQIRRFFRVSSRQKSRVPLDGIVGSFAFRHLTGALYNPLKFAEVFNIGKSAALGMGRIKVKTEY